MVDEIQEYWMVIVKFERKWFPMSAIKKKGSHFFDTLRNFLAGRRRIDLDFTPECRSHQEEQGSPPGADMAEVPRKFPSFVGSQR